jgi:hypothetical protein
LSGLTKVFIVLQLVFSLVVSVLLVLMVSKLEPYKSQLDSAHAGQIAAQALLAAEQNKSAAAQGAADQARRELTDAQSALQRTTTELNTRIASLTQTGQASEVKNAQAQTQITSLTNAIATLKDLLAEKDKQLNDLTPRVAQLTTQYNEVYRSNNELQNQLRGAEQTIRKLQEQIAQGPAQGGTGAAPASSDSQVASLSAANSQAPNAPINAKIRNVGQLAGRTVIELPIGTRDGVKASNRFFIYRNNAYIGEAVITTVTPDGSLATVQGNPAQSVQAGDMVMSAQ